MPIHIVQGVSAEVTCLGDYKLRQHDTATASELSMLINSLNLGSDALSVDEDEEGGEMHCTAMQCKACQSGLLESLALH